jgi:hypothetical protein
LGDVVVRSCFVEGVRLVGREERRREGRKEGNGDFLKQTGNA